MSRELLLEMARRSRAHAEAGTTDPADGVARIPARHYCDPERWRQEQARIFRRLPLVLGFSVELAEAGDYRSLTAANTPVLLTRGRDGAVRGFLNACRHRGAVVVPEGSGSGRRFVCPYHGWAYDDGGALVAIRHASSFGEVDRSCLGLTPLPVAERAGLIFGSLTPEASLDLDTFLCGYDALLEHHRFGECVVVGRQEVAGPNWKIAYDGYLDLYHLPVLHRETFGPDMASEALYDAWGPHQRVHAPDPAYLAKPEDAWSLERMISGIWTVFPHVSIASFDAGGKLYLVSQLFPGDAPGESRTIQTFLATGEPDAERRARIDAMMAFLLRVVRDEDYATGLRIQQRLQPDSRETFLFGRNEGGGQQFHRWVGALLETDDPDLPALFASGPAEEASP